MQPRAEPLRAGLTTIGSPSRAITASITCGGAELAERLVRQAHALGRGDADAGDHGLGDRLVERGAAGGRPGADVRDPEQVEDLADGAVLAALAVQHRDHARGRVGEQGGEQTGVDVALGHLEAGGPQGLGRTAARPQRDVALVGEAAGQHDDGIDRS